MKKLLTVCLLCLLCAPCFSHTAQGLNQDMRAAWVASVFNLDYPSAPNLSVSQLKAEADTILKKAAESGLNALFLQVRPCSDSLFPSSVFPWSAYLTGTQGKAPPDNFDPLSYFLKAAQPYHIAVHAWINPYRVTKGNFPGREAALASLSPQHPARKSPELVLFAADGNLYFDPGNPKAQALILSGVHELITAYPVAGIHLDDYFYPTSDFNDNATYMQNKQEGESQADFRRRNVTFLVYSLYEHVKKHNPDLLFGISPFGIWANSSTLPQGSNTHGSQSYYDHYADTRKWVLDGKLDYIMPQLYWHTGHTDADYTTLLHWWENTVSGTGVKLYVGLAAYRIPKAVQGEPWYGTREIAAQLLQNLASPICSGFSVFRMGNLSDVAGLSQLLSTHSVALQNAPLTLTVPETSIKTQLPRFYFCGKSCNALTVNGRDIPITQDGYFSVSLPLCYGQNTFLFQAGSFSVTKNVYRIYTPRPDTPAKSLFFETPHGLAEIPIYTDDQYGLVRFRFDHAAISTSFDPYKTMSLTATRDFTNIYREASSAQGAVGWLMDGDRFSVAAIKNNFAYLKDLGWVKCNQAVLSQKPLALSGDVTAIYQMETKDAVTVDFAYSGALFPVITRDDRGFHLTVSGCRDTVLPEGPPLSAVQVSYESSGIVYHFFPPVEQEFFGWYLEKYDRYFRLILRKPPAPAADKCKPLSGIAILLDPGHGGLDLGALSCDPSYPEKTLNLRYGLRLGEKLSDLGADVAYTRQDDSSLELSQRFLMAYTQKPHLFLSLHSNSVPYHTNPNHATGISLYSNGTISAQLGDFMLNSLSKSGLETTVHIQNSNLYMTKPHFSYALLLENQFVTNPASLTLLLSTHYLECYTDAVAAAIVGYFMPS